MDTIVLDELIIVVIAVSKKKTEKMFHENLLLVLVGLVVLVVVCVCGARVCSVAVLHHDMTDTVRAQNRSLCAPC